VEKYGRGRGKQFINSRLAKVNPSQGLFLIPAPNPFCAFSLKAHSVLSERITMKE
jgi:hypothetical protein